MEALSDFKIYLLDKGKKKRTIANNVGCMDRLLRFAPNLTLPEIKSYFSSLREKGLGVMYINHHIIALRIYAEFNKSVNSFKGELKLYKPRQTVKATLSDSEIEEFLTLPPTARSQKGKYFRWTLYFKILAYSGMRPGEVASLTINQIDFGRGIFVLEDTKTNEPRYVPIAPILEQELTNYLKRLPTDHLFVSKKRKEGIINSDDWMVAFRNRCNRLGIRRPHLTAHSFRHSFITRMLAEDVNLSKVQKIVGHKNIATTDGYTHLVTKDIIRAIKKDPLSRQSLAFNERFRLFRDIVRKALEDHCITPKEERKMIKDLFGSKPICMR